MLQMNADGIVSEGPCSRLPYATTENTLKECQGKYLTQLNNSGSVATSRWPPSQWC